MQDAWGTFLDRVYPPEQASGDFTPPSRQAVDELLLAYPPTPPAAWWNWVPLGVLALAVGIGLLSPPAWAWLTPWPVLFAGLAYMRWRSNAQRWRVRSTERLRDLLLLRRYRDTMRLAWRALPSLTPAPALWAQGVGALGESLEATGEYAAADACYDALAGVLTDDHPLRRRLTAARATLALRDDRLADADDALRRARSTPGDDSPIAQADLAVATLYQRIRTHHVADGAALADETRPKLWALGVSAAYGHALAALCYRRVGRLDDATIAWGDARALLPVGALLHRYAELSELMDAPA